MATKKSHSRKVQLADELEAHFDNFKSILVVEADNVGSNQLHEIRKNMRGKCLIYCGKNTQMRRVMRKLEEAGRPELEKLRQAMKLNVALVFTNESLSDIKKELEANKLPAAARAGSIAQCAVVIPAGVTSLEPTQTNFLQALNIGSKITKGQIEIIAEVKLFMAGDKVDSSQAALLQKMAILPFAYGLVCIKAFDDGSLFDVSVLDISMAQVIGSFKQGVKNVAAVSIMCNMPNMASVSYSILLAYANLLAIACETDFTFTQAEAVRAALKK